MMFVVMLLEGGGSLVEPPVGVNVVPSSDAYCRRSRRRRRGAHVRAV